MTFSRLSYCDLLWNEGASLVTQMVKNLPAMLEIWVRSLVWENPLEKGMATHSSILAWRITRTEATGHGSPRVGHNWTTNTFTFTGMKNANIFHLLGVS